MVLSVSDPTHKLKNAVIKVDGKYISTTNSANADIRSESETTVIDIDFSGITGESISFELTRN